MTESTSILYSEATHFGPAIRTRTGCLTCRRRKKKCDEIHPHCTGCERNGLQCEWETTSAVEVPRRRRRRPLPEKPLPGQEQGMVNVFTVLKPDTVSRLLNHFIHASPRWLSTRTGSRRTDYLECLIPTISQSPLVLSCILAVASADLVKYERGDSELHHVAVEYYGQAVSGLRNAIEIEMADAVASDDYNPLAVLLLCLHETQNFTDTERIIPHLNAAIFLLRNRVSGECENMALRGYIFEMFCYFFALTAYSLGSKLLLRQAHDIFSSPCVIRHLQNGHIMGTSQYLFVTIFRVSTLAQSLIFGEDDKKNIIERELSTIDQDLAASQMFLVEMWDLDPEHLSDAVTSELYRLACRIYLKKILDPSIPDFDEGIQLLLVDFVKKLECLPTNSPSNNILSWPLVVAGLCATVHIHQRIIATKLTQIHEEWQSEIFSKSAAFLREKWRNDRNQNSDQECTIQQQTAGQKDAFAYGQLIWYKLPVILA